MAIDVIKLTALRAAVAPIEEAVQDAWMGRRVWCSLNEGMDNDGAQWRSVTLGASAKQSHATYSWMDNGSRRCWLGVGWRLYRRKRTYCIVLIRDNFGEDESEVWLWRAGD